MKRTVSAVILLLILVMLVLGQVAWGSTKNNPPKLPSPADRDASSVASSETPSIAGRLSDASSPVGEKTLVIDEAWSAGTPSEGSGSNAPAGPEALTLYSIADAFVLQGYASDNFGKTTNMWAGYDDNLDPDGEIVRSLVEFDISGLPSGKSIKEARLRVYMNGFWDFPDASRLIKTHRVTSSWSEGSVNWNNQPGNGESYGEKQILVAQSFETWHEFDVKDLVQSWYDGTHSNHGIMIRGEETAGYDSGWRSFGTRESSYRPQLVVELEDTNPCGDNTDPVISGLPDLTVHDCAGGSNAISLWSHASDAESTDGMLTFSINSPPPHASAGVSIKSNRYLDVCPVAGWVGQTTVTIRVTDPCNAWDTDSLVVTVRPQGNVRVYLPTIQRNQEPPPPHEPNNNFGQAWGPLTSGQSLRSNFFSPSDKEDYFWFQMPATHNIEMWLTDIPAGNDFDLYLYDEIRSHIGYSGEPNNKNEHILKSNRSPGKYYVRVLWKKGASRAFYTLRVVYK